MTVLYLGQEGLKQNKIRKKRRKKDRYNYLQAMKVGYRYNIPSYSNHHYHHINNKTQCHMHVVKSSINS